MRSPKNEIVFLFDVDNTLLDNDRVIADLRRYLMREVGSSCTDEYFTIFEQLRNELGYADYLGALQRYRLANPREPRLIAISSYLVNYPFANRLYPGSLDVLERFEEFGPAVADRVLVYTDNGQELNQVARRFPAEHYVLVDDKLRILAAVKRAWGPSVTAVFVRQGHYANDAEIVAKYPPADITVERI